MNNMDSINNERSFEDGHPIDSDMNNGNASQELYKEISLIRKHLDALSDKVASAFGEAESESEQTLTAQHCKLIADYLAIEKPYDRWKLLTFFFDLHKSEPELQRLLIGLFRIDCALHTVETDNDAEAKEKYPEAYHEWSVLVNQHRKAVNAATYIRSNCSDEFPTVLLTVFNHLNSCIEDKMVFLWAYFSRDLLCPQEEDTLHRSPASMEWLYDDPDYQLRALDDASCNHCDIIDFDVDDED